MPRKRRRGGSQLDPTLSRGIIAVVLVIAALIIGLAFFGNAGVVGVMLDEYVLSALFGSIRYTVPLILLILAWFLIKDIEYDFRPTHGIGALLFFLSLSGIMHLSFMPDDMWQKALEGFGGGIFGMSAWPLKTYLGTVASMIILIGLAVVSVLLIFNTSVAAFVLLHRTLFSSLGRLGEGITSIVKNLFVRDGVKVRGDYEEVEDDDEEEYEEEPRRGFFKRSRLTEDEQEYEEEDDEEDEEEYEQDESSAPVRPTKDSGKTEDDGVWGMKVVIKKPPALTLLSSKRGKPTSGDIKANSEIIKDTLAQFNINVTMGEVRVGPTVTQYSFKPAKGIKLSRITGLANDLALALAAHPIRIEAPIPGKSLVGVEVPNQKAALVSFKELLTSKEYKGRAHNTMIALGKDVGGKTWFADLPRMPHLLIAGATGSGKTVCVNTIIMSLLYQNTAETLRMIMVDPKRVELTLYNGIPHLLTPVITNTHQTVNALKWTTKEMDRRFDMLGKARVRDIASYNKKYPNDKLPHIAFIIDELADLMQVAANEVEAGIIRLAQMARAVGIHLIVATQRPSVDVITGLMKANIPARIAFSVASLMDSRTILDTPGAEKLLGRGDMLFLTAELSKPVRIQNSFVSEEEVKRVVRYLKGGEKVEYAESITGKQTGGTANLFGGPSDDQDALFNDAKDAVIAAGKASASFLQRKLKVGYARAARILDELEEAGIIGPSQGSKPREILMTQEQADGTMGSASEANAFVEDENIPEELEDEEEYEEDEEEDYEDDEDDIDEDTEDYDEDEEEELEDEEEYEEDEEEDYEDDEDDIDEDWIT